MKRPVLIIFIAALLGLFIWLWYNRPELSFLPEARQTARTIIPSSDNTNAVDTTPNEADAAYDESKIQPLIVLNSDETFIQAISVDLNKDGVADQICAVKKMSEPNIFLIPALQNPATGEYSRINGIRTGITQTRTLLFYSTDIIGDRTNALIYSGMTADNQQLLAVYLPIIEKDGKMSFIAVADLRADGAITIQEIKRSDAYNMGLTNGESYPIYTYNSDPDSPQTLDQIERKYRWDKPLKRYEQVSEARITGKKIETKLIRQLQGGDVHSFQDFLSGLWYMPDSASGTDTKHLYFDASENEIIFNNGSTEEVFISETGTPRHYGAYLITHNRTIPSIRRLIDIELTGIDEIRIKIMEDVKLKIGVASDWDGVYRKMATGMNTTTKTETAISVEKLKGIMASSANDWNSSDGMTFQTTNTRYSLVKSNGTETGLMVVMTVKGQPVLQLKPESPSNAKSRFYLGTAQVMPVAGGESQTLTLTEVAVSIDGTNLVGSPPVIFERKK